jgi:membrane-bound lytic murein transglycosylase D
MAAASNPKDSDQRARAEQCPICRNARKIVLLILLVTGLTGCVGTDIKPDANVAREPAAPPAIPIAVPQAVVPEPPVAPLVAAPDPLIWSSLRDGFSLPDYRHPRIDREVRRLTHSRQALRELLLRAEPYLYHILSAVQDAGLPTEIALLPAVESGFRTHAYSPDGAAGLWQFMPATGQMLGLQRNWWFDGRRDVPDSTQAAITYLSRLNERFDGDWLHALAAYNAGSRRVGRAIHRAARDDDATDFWSLDLPGETDAYVPRLLALVRVVSDPAAFSIELPDIANKPYFDALQTDGQIDLNIVADLTGISVEHVLRLNAGYRRWATPPQGPHRLQLPVEHHAAFEHAIVSLPVDQRLRWQRHRIVRGDSLIRIARQYGVTVKAIKQSNSLRDSRIRAGQDLLIPLTESVDARLATASNNQARDRVKYRVRRGDSLYAIARRFQVTIADLRRWNQVGRYLQPGERIIVFIDPDI